jgi:hypothetical protein
MAHGATPAATVEQQRNILEGFAKRIADDIWGAQGPAWGTTLTEMEDIALAARDIFTQKLLELGVRRQAAAMHEQRPPAAGNCPKCERPFDAAAAASPREMQTRGGGVHWDEPKEYCSRCRRAFFPSEQKPGCRPHHL